MNNCFACITTPGVVRGLSGLVSKPDFGFAFGPGPGPVPGRWRGRRWWQWCRPSILRAILQHRLPQPAVLRITGVHSNHAQAGGWLLAVPLPRRQGKKEISFLPEPPLQRRLLRAGRRAKKMGARLTGLDLAAFTAAGMTEAVAVALARNLGLAVTTGGSFAVVAALEGIRTAAVLAGHALETAGVVILRATAPRGAACARILAREGVDRITLVDPDRFRLEALAGRILYESGVSCKAVPRAHKVVLRAGVIVVLDDGVNDFAQAGALRSGSVLCDMTGSQSLARHVSALRRDVLVTGGAVFKTPGKICSRRQSGCSSLHLGSACLAETMLLALERRFENYSLGTRLRVEKVVEMRRLAAKHGFEPVGLHSFSSPGGGRGGAARVEEVKGIPSPPLVGGRGLG